MQRAIFLQRSVCSLDYSRRTNLAIRLFPPLLARESVCPVEMNSVFEGHRPVK